MNEQDPVLQDAPAAIVRLPRGYCWMPIINVEVGQVLAKPLLSGTGMHASLHLAAGFQLTASTIAQLINKGIECVAVVQETPPDAEAYAAIVRQYESRLQEIFGPDPDPNCRALLDALLEDGPCQC